MTQENDGQPVRQSGDPEREQRPIRVVRYSHSVAVINTRAELAAWGQQLADELQDGVPDTWHRLDTHGHTMLGEIDGRQFLVKYKQARRPTGGEHDGLLTDRQVNAGESLVSEIRLSSTVAEAVASPELQAAVQELGFKGVRFVEPIVGMAVRHSDDTDEEIRSYDIANTGTTKFVAYEYIPGARVMDDEYQVDLRARTGMDTLESMRLIHQVVNAIGNRIVAAGLWPTDYSDVQLLIDDKDYIYLVDSEMYVPLRNGRPA